jgi:hypothetical protein
LAPTEVPNSQFSVFGNGYWEENGDTQAFADENANVNIPGLPVQNRPPYVGGPEMQSHAEILRRKLEQVSLKENGSSKHAFRPPISNADRALNDAAPPFFSRNKQGIEDRMPLTLDRTNDQKITTSPLENKVFGNVKNTKSRPPGFHNENRPPPRRSLSFGVWMVGLLSLITCNLHLNLNLNLNFSLIPNLDLCRLDLSQRLIQFPFHFRIRLIVGLTTRSLKMPFLLPSMIPIPVAMRRKFRGGSEFFRRLLFLQAPRNDLCTQKKSIMHAFLLVLGGSA